MQYEEIAALFPDYLDGSVSDSQRQKVIDALDSSIELQQMLDSYRELKQGQQQWQEEEIPHWHRSAFLPRPRAKQYNWMNWISMSTSVAAIFLVVFQVQITSTADGVSINFNQQGNQAGFDKTAADFLADWKIEQTAYIDNRLLEYQNLQLKENQQVLTSALEYNRDQRRQDLNQLTSYFLQQRSSDLNKSQTQFRMLLDSQLEDKQAIETLYASIEK